MSDNILEIKNVTKKFTLGNDKIITACDNITFNVKRGETVAIVGESGCGKTTLLRGIMNIDPITSGEILFYPKNENCRDIAKLKGEELRKNYRHIQMIFQDATTAFNPRMRIKNIIMEPLINFNIIKKTEINEKAAELLELAELSKDYSDRYPHQLSGGERQRAAIARAASISPEIIVCDEATSALDVSVQDNIIKLLVKLQREKGLTYIFVSHDLALVSAFAHRIVVMYMGKIVEIIDGDKLQEAKHPYTRALLNSAITLCKQNVKH